jgi:leukotriene-A4 hydrolase
VPAKLYLLTGALLICAACSKGPVQNQSQKKFNDTKDYHSYSNPEQIKVKHVGLDIDVLFAEKKLKGSATLSVERVGSKDATPLILDTRDLVIGAAQVSTDGSQFVATKFHLGQRDPILGAPLTIEVPRNVSHVRITYETSPNATALQWLTPAQTAGKKHPFLYTQSQAIHARSWMPIQESA